MFNNKLLISGVVILFIGVVLFWIFYDPYRPKVYIGIVKSEYEQDLPVVDRSYIYEIDLLEGEISDAFPVSDTVPHVNTIDVAGQEQRLFVAGEERDYANRWSNGIDVYDLETKSLFNSFSLEGNAPLERLRVSSDGKKLFIENPYKETEKPTGQKGETTWLVDNKTGEFIKGINRQLGEYYFTDSGDTWFYFPGSKERGISLLVYSVVDNKVVEFLGSTDDLKEVYGGIRFQDYNFKYPYIESNGRIYFYDRETLEKLGEIDPFVNFEVSKESINIGPKNITKDREYLIVSFTIPNGEEGAEQTIVRIIDLIDLSIENTIIIKGISNHTNLVAY